jgi:hypothetical protein
MQTREITVALDGGEMGAYLAIPGGPPVSLSSSNPATNRNPRRGNVLITAFNKFRAFSRVRVAAFPLRIRSLR